MEFSPKCGSEKFSAGLPREERFLAGAVRRFEMTIDEIVLSQIQLSEALK
jgi:hypothetical protein